MRESGEFEHARKLGGGKSRWSKFIPGIVGIIAALLTLALPLFDKFEKVGEAFSAVLFPGLLFFINVGLAEYWGLLVAAAFNGILYCGLTWLALILWRTSFQ